MWDDCRGRISYFSLGFGRGGGLEGGLLGGLCGRDLSSLRGRGFECGSGPWGRLLIFPPTCIVV